MAFTKVLYYPWIDIQDEYWLKNAMLYWESVSTIVPESLDNPYLGQVTEALAGEGLLLPYTISPRSKAVREITDDFSYYIHTKEASDTIELNQTQKESDYLPPREFDLIYVDKMAHSVISELIYQKNAHYTNTDKYILVEKSISGIYMTLLASRICDQEGYGLITDTRSYNQLAENVKVDAKQDIILNKNRPRKRKALKPELSEGALASLILRGLQVNPDTPVEKIIKFRKLHSDEVGKFRVKVAELVQSINGEEEPDALRQKLSDIYTNEVTPSINDLQECLKDLRIQYSINNFIKLSCFSTTPLIPVVAFGMATPLALLAGPGISLTTSFIMYNRDKKKLLRENPYSYLLSIRESFS